MNNLRAQFNREINDLEVRRFRVWTRVANHLKETKAVEIAQRPWIREWGLMPLMSSLLLVALSSGSLSVFSNSLPGDKLYAVKVAVEDAQVKLALSPESRVEAQVSLITKRAEEVNKLSVKTVNTTDQKESVAIAQAHADIGRQVVNLLKEDQEVQKLLQKTETPVDSRLAATVSVADYEKIGAAVTEFLRSNPQETKTTAASLKQVVKTAALAENKEPVSEPVETKTPPATVAVPAEKPAVAAPIEPADKEEPESIIEVTNPPVETIQSED